ncbi:hypothetical protein [Candidatus Finniella inopinata]|uniref:HEAT repeat domain-containing protein n=1 Tax=Candidatus Finniella inopinata TaxID=1696036 RepID=A0A4Q7DLS6_9PROT|nr:hypothetical protein [Candidatus Finniella inopinata]RZI45706.1 hypothetical protein EQU50_06290 [Candidatus Finniella inopinata]
MIILRKKAHSLMKVVLLLGMALVSGNATQYDRDESHEVCVLRRHLQTPEPYFVPACGDRKEEEKTPYSSPSSKEKDEEKTEDDPLSFQLDDGGYSAVNDAYVRLTKDQASTDDLQLLQRSVPIFLQDSDPDVKLSGAQIGGVLAQKITTPEERLFIGKSLLFAVGLNDHENFRLEVAVVFYILAHYATSAEEYALATQSIMQLLPRTPDVMVQPLVVKLAELYEKGMDCTSISRSAIRKSVEVFLKAYGSCLVSRGIEMLNAISNKELSNNDPAWIHRQYLSVLESSKTTHDEYRKLLLASRHFGQRFHLILLVWMMFLSMSKQKGAVIYGRIFYGQAFQERNVLKEKERPVPQILLPVTDPVLRL